MKAVGTSVIAISLLLGLSVGGRVSAQDKNTGPSEKLSKHLGEKTLAILKGADRVEVFRLNPDRKAQGEKRCCNVLITATGKEQGKAFAGSWPRF
jgi:hypothetical protein